MNTSITITTEHLDQAIAEREAGTLTGHFDVLSHCVFARAFTAANPDAKWFAASKCGVCFYFLDQSLVPVGTSIDLLSNITDAFDAFRYGPLRSMLPVTIELAAPDRSAELALSPDGV